MLDPLKRKQLKKGLEQLAQEGIDPALPAAGGARGRRRSSAPSGELQFDVVKHRLQRRVRRRRAARAPRASRWRAGSRASRCRSRSSRRSSTATARSTCTATRSCCSRANGSSRRAPKAFPKTRFVELGQRRSEDRDGLPANRGGGVRGDPPIRWIRTRLRETMSHALREGRGSPPPLVAARSAC